MRVRLEFVLDEDTDLDEAKDLAEMLLLFAEEEVSEADEVKVLVEQGGKTIYEKDGAE